MSQLSPLEATTSPIDGGTDPTDIRQKGKSGIYDLQAFAHLKAQVEMPSAFGLIENEVLSSCHTVASSRVAVVVAVAVVVVVVEGAWQCVMCCAVLSK